MLNYFQIASSMIKDIGVKPEIALILGSGLGYLTCEFQDSVIVDYSQIPGFPASTVEGHSGRFVFGSFHGIPSVAMEGRFHCYEGHEIGDVVSPIYLFKEMGIERLLITNASGGINRTYSPGDIVAIRDIINLGFINPLRGPNDEKFGVRFPDMSSVVDLKWLAYLRERLSRDGRELKEGTYIWTLGPSYESPSEIKSFEFLGADMVGMSTVPEVIAANHCRMKVLALSCITNMASGILKEKLSHEDVVGTANRIRHRFSDVVGKALEVLKEIDGDE